MSLKTEDTNAIETITQSIVVVRSQRVLLDAELAALYGVATKALNQAVKRNSARFPADFLFRLTSTEMTALDRSQSVTGSDGASDQAVGASGDHSPAGRTWLRESARR